MGELPQERSDEDRRVYRSITRGCRGNGRASTGAKRRGPPSLLFHNQEDAAEMGELPQERSDEDRRAHSAASSLQVNNSIIAKRRV
jgi:hypothetical protein